LIPEVFKMHLIKTGLAVLASLFLSGCSSGMKAGLMTLKDEVMPSRSDVRKTALQPDYRYLLVETDGQEALMVWIGNEPHRLGQASVWVSSDGVIIRLVNGKLVGVSEPRRHWQLISESIVTSPPPGSSITRLTQTSDAQPGYRMGVMRTVDQKVLPAGEQAMAWVDHSLALRWQEEVDSNTGERTALYGLNSSNQITAGHRCMTAQWCLRWQTWPAKASAPLL
jgi:hypothetical protein